MTIVPVFASERTAARLLDMEVEQFRQLVKAGALPKPVLINDILRRWEVATLGEYMVREDERP